MTSRSLKFEELLRKEVEESREDLRRAKEAYRRARRALHAYLDNDGEEEPSPALSEAEAKTINRAVRKAVSMMDDGAVFSTRALFDVMDDGSMTYHQARPSISSALARLVRLDRLEKTSWREFRKLPVETSSD